MLDADLDLVLRAIAKWERLVADAEEKRRVSASPGVVLSKRHANDAAVTVQLAAQLLRGRNAGLAEKLDRLAADLRGGR